MRWTFVLLCLLGCGRLGFDALRGGADGDATGDGSDAPLSTGPVGPRWIAKSDWVSSHRVNGSNGRLVSIVSFSGTYTGDGYTLTSPAATSTALVRYDTMGTMLSATALSSDGFCDMRAVVTDGSDLVLAGLAQATQALPQYGACGVVSGRQDPIVMRIDSAGQQTLVAYWDATAANAQSWAMSLLPDHSAVVSGIYGDDLKIGPANLPTAGVDSNFWIARTSSTDAMDAAWWRAVVATTPVEPGPLAADGPETCVLGAFSGPTTVFGTSLPHAGSFDVFVARLDASGNPMFVRAIGSPADESYSGDGSIVALPNGGCMVGIDAPGNVTLDGTLYPVTVDRGLAVAFDATGAVTSARRFAGAIYVTRVGTRLIGAYDLSTPLMIGSTLYTPAGVDVAIVELGATPQQDVLLGSVGGGGDQYVFGLQMVGPDAVAFTVQSTGELTFGGQSSNSGTTAVRAIGVLGI